jgi:hypothetical protein
MATVYASSPEAQPALQTRTWPAFPLAAAMRGRMSEARYSQAGGSRKKEVTLMRMVLNSRANSSGWTSS